MMPARGILKVPLKITNPPGGAGVKASTYVRSQPADGYPIYNFSPEQLIHTIFGRENYKEFVPLCNVQQDQSMFYVRAESPYKTIQGVIISLLEAKKFRPLIVFTEKRPEKFPLLL